MAIKIGKPNLEAENHILCVEYLKYFELFAHANEYALKLVLIFLSESRIVKLNYNIRLSILLTISPNCNEIFIVNNL